MRDSKVVLGVVRGVRDYTKGKMGSGPLGKGVAVNAPYDGE